MKDIFKRNGYPINLTDKCIRQFLQKLYVPKKVEHTVNKKQLLLVLPYLGALSFQVRSRLQSCIKNHLPFCNLRVVFQSKTRLCNLFRFKDAIPKELNSNLVYKFLRNGCNATYYGKTQRHLKVRASEHIGVSPLTGKRVKTPKKSAICDHILEKGHDVSFDDFNILTKETNAFKLLIKESLLISRDKPELNKNVYSIPLELFS